MVSHQFAVVMSAFSRTICVCVDWLYRYERDVVGVRVHSQLCICSITIQYCKQAIMNYRRLNPLWIYRYTHQTISIIITRSTQVPSPLKFFYFFRTNYVMQSAFFISSYLSQYDWTFLCKFIKILIEKCYASTRHSDDCLSGISTQTDDKWFWMVLMMRRGTGTESYQNYKV